MWVRFHHTRLRWIKVYMDLISATCIVQCLARFLRHRSTLLRWIHFVRWEISIFRPLDFTFSHPIPYPVNYSVSKVTLIVAVYRRNFHLFQCAVGQKSTSRRQVNSNSASTYITLKCIWFHCSQNGCLLSVIRRRKCLHTNSVLLGKMYWENSTASGMRSEWSKHKFELGREIRLNNRGYPYN